MQKRKKRILILSNVTYDLYSMRREVVQAILDAGYDVSISAILGKNTEDFARMGCQMIDAPIDRRGTNPIADLKLIVYYRKLLKEIEPDIVLTYTIKPNLYGGMVCSQYNVPYLSNVTGLGSAFNSSKFMQKVIVKLYKFGIKKCTCLFFQNINNYQTLVKKNIPIKKYRILPGSGVNLEYHCFEEYPETENGIRFLFIGRIMKEKGVDELLKAAELVKQKYKNVNFDIVGDLQEGYQRILDNYSKCGIINFYGRQDDIHGFIKRSHVTILPSYHEGMSNVLLETAAVGRPVIASNVPGCRETFEEGVSGFGFQVKNVEDLSNKLIKFINLAYEDKKAMGLAGRLKMESEFSRELIVKAYMEEIEKIVSD